MPSDLEEIRDVLGRLKDRGACQEVTREEGRFCNPHEDDDPCEIWGNVLPLVEAVEEAEKVIEMSRSDYPQSDWEIGYQAACSEIDGKIAKALAPLIREGK